VDAEAHTLPLSGSNLTLITLDLCNGFLPPFTIQLKLKSLTNGGSHPEVVAFGEGSDEEVSG
jgi:hypothetical protein